MTKSKAYRKTRYTVWYGRLDRTGTQVAESAGQVAFFQSLHAAKEWCTYYRQDKRIVWCAIMDDLPVIYDSDERKLGGGWWSAKAYAVWKWKRRGWDAKV